MALTTDQRKAILVIKNYLNVNGVAKYTDDYIMAEFDLAIEEIIEVSIVIKSIKTVGIKSKSEGNQSVTFESDVEAWSITENIRNLLPRPFVRLRG